MANPLLSPLGSLFISRPFEGGLIQTGGGAYLRGGLFNLEKTTVSVLHKKLGYKVAKFKYKKVGGHAAEVRIKSELPIQLVNKLSRMSTHKGLQS